MEIYSTNKLVFDSQTNVRRAINDGSNLAMPKIALPYAESLTVIKILQTIINDLRTHYAQVELMMKSEQPD